MNSPVPDLKLEHSSQPSEFIIQFESFLTDEDGQETWASSELVFDSEDADYHTAYKIISQMQDEGLVRQLQTVQRIVDNWLI
jgi:hypothetical protein